MAISKKSFLGVAREATPGTAATTPTLYVPTKSMVKAIQNRVYLDEERGDRNDNYDVVPTIRHGEWDIKGPYYNDTMVYFMGGALGSITSTQPNAGTDPTVWKHTVGLADNPLSLTLFKSFDAKTYYLPYSVVEKFAFKFSSDNKLLEFDASGKSIWPQKYSGAALTPTYSNLKPFPGYVPTITLTSGATTDIDEFEIAFEQKISYWTPASGSPDWTTAYFGGRKVTVSFTARFDSDTLYETYFRTPQNDTITVDFLGPVIADTYKQELHIQIPVIDYDSMEHDLGKDNVLVKAKATALATGTGAGNNLIQIYAQNTVTSYTI